MKRQLFLLTALALAGTGSAASAATLTLGMDTDEEPGVFRGVDLKPDGSLTIGIRRGYFVQRYLARITADDGVAIGSCLPAGTELLLVDEKRAVRAKASLCPGKDGMYEMRPVGKASIQTPTTLTAQLVTPVSLPVPGVEGAMRVASPAVSNTLRVRIEPNMVNESPKLFVGAGEFPVQFRIAGPAIVRAGTFTVRQRTADKKWVTKGRFKADRNGRMRTRVETPDAVNRYSVVFTPTARSKGWLPTVYFLTIRNTTDSPDPTTSPTAPPTTPTQARLLSITRG